MKVIKLLLLILMPLTAMFSACQGQDGYVIKGTIKGANGLQATLDQSFFDRTNTTLGKATCDAEGNFSIAQKEPFQQGLYTLTIGAKKMFFMLGGQEKTVEVKGDLGTLEKLDVQVTGSETFTCYADFVKALYATPLTAPEQAKTMIEQKGCNPLMKAFFTSQLLGRSAAQFVGEFRTASKNLNTYMPNSRYATDYGNLIAQLEAQIAGAGQTPAAAESKIKVGQPAPDIALPDPDGKVRSLAGLKGKVVLLDFWASWCGPCRRANPHVVEVYNKYKGQGFDVFSVSLDRPDGKEKWKQAIKQDGLLWDNHVSDLQFWQSAPAGVYGVRAIPHTFLIGRDGKIVAVNPRDNLEQELLKVL